uniref:Uncharacterized protein n=1 Tax=Rhizophora mucronata TaxID=61149 RepID=A0A2P2K6H7_RHIMU
MFKASAAASSVGVGRYDDESPTSPTDKLLSPGPRPKLPCKVLLSAALSLYPWFVGFLDVQRLLGNIWYPTEELGSPVPVDSIIGTPSLVIDSSGKPQSFVGLEESYVNNEAKCLALGLRNLYTCPVLRRNLTCLSIQSSQYTKTLLETVSNHAKCLNYYSECISNGQHGT